MLVELEEPFRSNWKNGYLRVESDGRRYLSLYNTQGDQTSISYARYLMCVRLGYILSSDYEVDHRNDDKTDDRIENLQVLTKEENLIKQQWRYAEYEQVWFGYICACCDYPFMITEAERNKRLAQTRSGLAFCSKACSTYYFPVGKAVIDPLVQDKIRLLHNQGLSSYQIAEQTGVSRNTVMKYW